MRRRHVVGEPTGSAGKCPHLVEAIHCEDSVCYHWDLLEEGRCIAENNQTCGQGFYNHSILCKNNQGKLHSD